MREERQQAKKSKPTSLGSDSSKHIPPPRSEINRLSEVRPASNAWSGHMQSIKDSHRKKRTNADPPYHALKRVFFP